MSRVLKCALVILAMTAASSSPFAQQPPAGQPDMTPAMQAEIERQFFIGVVALKNHCKAVDKANAAAIEDSWTKDTADMPAELKALAATPEFAAKVTARVKELGDSSTTPTAAAEIKAACAKMIAAK